MMDASMLSNLAAYSAQIAIVAAVGSLLPRLLRIDSATIRYTYWRALLALCVVLPWVQGRHAGTSPGDATAIIAVTADVVGVSASAGAVQSAGVPWLTVLGLVLIGGSLLRLVWVARGLRHLKTLRTAGEPAPPGEHDELQRRVRTRAAIRYVPGLGQPVTFGAWRPVVLLPETLRDHPPQIRQAVLCHELFHVQRRDWLWVLAEEAVRAALWFHPGVWWLISRVQLAREEVVDELAVRTTGKRRTYIAALLAFADETPLSPATAFARRRHLFRRMVLISKEAAMSWRRVVSSCAVMALVVVAGSWYAVSAFPMMAAPGAQELQNEPGPVERRANPITPENPIPRRLQGMGAIYPGEALAIGARATVTLRVTMDEFGRIAEARRTNVQQFGGSWPAPPTPDETQRLADAFARSAIMAVRQWLYEAPANGPISFFVTLAFTPDADATLVAQDVSDRGATVPRSFQAPGGSTPGALRVGGDIRPPVKIKDVRPMYPPEARSAKVQGVVILETTISADGRVEDARILRSIPLLDQAALDAVLQWEFVPTLMNGQPVPVVMTVTVQFTLT